MKKDREYLGTVKNGKIVYETPTYNALSHGNWKDGFGGVIQTGGDEIVYEIKNPEDIIEGKFYHFKLLDDDIVEIIQDKKFWSNKEKYETEQQNKKLLDASLLPKPPLQLSWEFASRYNSRKPDNMSYYTGATDLKNLLIDEMNKCIENDVNNDSGNLNGFNKVVEIIKNLKNPKNKLKY